MFTKEAVKLAKEVCEAIPIIAESQGKKWEWEPKVGEWCLINPSIIKESQLIVKVDPEALNPIQTHQGYGFTYPDLYPKILHYNTVIPLLHWEKLERIMYQLGFTMENPIFLSVWKTHFSDQAGTKYRESYAETRQLAVMKAILAVAESLRR